MIDSTDCSAADTILAQDFLWQSRQCIDENDGIAELRKTCNAKRRRYQKHKVVKRLQQQRSTTRRRDANLETPSKLGNVSSGWSLAKVHDNLYGKPYEVGVTRLGVPPATNQMVPTMVEGILKELFLMDSRNSADKHL